MKAHLPNHPTQLYLIRHGEVQADAHRVFAGSRLDVDLSPRGREHGVAIARWMKGTKLDAIYASPMRRVHQTIAPLVAQTRQTPIVMQDLRETDFGDWSGLNWEQVKERFAVSAFDWLEVLEAGGIPNGETARTVLDRVRPCVKQILHENPHRTVAVACHGGIIRVILALLLDLPLSRMAHFNIEYGSVSVVELQPEKKHAIEIELLNFCPLRDFAVRG